MKTIDNNTRNMWQYVIKGLLKSGRNYKIDRALLSAVTSKLEVQNG